MAVADNPMFPSEDEAAAIGLCCPENLILQDWQTYFVKFYGDNVPDYFPKREAGLYTQRSFPDQLFEISFRNAVGRTRIGPVCVRVESSKIISDHYDEMLSYIADKFSNLVFSFATPLGQNYRKEKTGKDIAYIEYLFLKNYLLDASPNLDAISALIVANPHIKLYRAFCNCSIDAVTNVQPAMLINMFTASDRFTSLKSGHPLITTNLGQKIFNKTGKNFYPTEAIEERKHLTVDTNENRFVKHFLQTIPRRLNGLRDVLTSEKKSYLNPDIEQHLDEMTHEIAAFLADPLWHDVGGMAFIPISSQVLHRRDGYRQLFQLYSLLQLTSKCDFFNKDDFQNILETKDTPTLFEYWAFFVVKDILDSLLKPIPCRNIISASPLEQHVEPGICITYEGGISLWFNKTYRGSSEHQPGDSFAGNEKKTGSYSHDFRPDIVIEINNKRLIFDAKFKGKRDGFYGESDDGSTFSCKEEDIDKMHCYREAIKGVTGAYILYPGEKAVVYSAHDATCLYEGVGALPLQPEAGARPVQRHREDIEQILREFIKDT
ncbi:MAG: DUF2357 domain-containing protein [Deltaproteobacteria bacterium]|nr:DUF2357 domain-containing protein [Deltaproteobacteria bacterium]